jgi:hypothetical protein
VFADGLTFFVCSKSVWREDLVTEETEIMAGQGEITSSFQRPLQPGNDPAAAISAYISCVEVYSRRNLSFAEDGLNAFAGISKILENDLGTSMFYGLPIKYFELALLWAPKRINLTRRQGFPTWTWAGWSSSVDISSLQRATDWLRSVGLLKTKNDYEYYDPATASFCSVKTYSNSSQVQSSKDRPRMPRLEARPNSPFEPDSSVDLAGMIRFRALCTTFSIAIFEQPQTRSDRSNIAIFDIDDNLIGELEDGHEWQLEAMPHLLGVHEVVIISEKLSEPWHYTLFPSSYNNYTSVNGLRSIGSAPDQLRTRGSSLLSQVSAIPQVRSVRSRLDMKLHKASNWGLLNVMVV